MKKWIAMMLSVFMVFTLAACGNTQNESDRTTSGSTGESQETKTPRSRKIPVNDNGNPMVYTF